ncbi:Histone-lysine N-methyltransferase SETMAR [Eumeta japonica]|uniref:Histone-lysine N-methyltransferase SETMAR n=1 Tax=Eumeta variegata TaxID=151549 RepID=A0A4C1ZJT8_EUMVA|nr:Histone-lysine N-methyltransferase SETMAR [Eumeta japonica]
MKRLIYVSESREVGTVQRTKLCRSELLANDALRRSNAPGLYPFLPRVPILCHCNAFVTNFTAAEFRALYCVPGNFDVKDEPRSGRPVTNKVDAILEKVEQDRHISSYDIAEEHEIGHKTVLTDLKKAGYIKKLCTWVPHELTESNEWCTHLRFSIET